MNPAPTSEPRRNPIRKHGIIEIPTPTPIISFGDPFELSIKNILLQQDSDFDTRIELKFSGDNITIVSLNQNDSKKYNADSLIKLPLLVKNIKYEGGLLDQVNGTSYEIYGPSGNRLDDILYYDDSYNFTTYVGDRALWLNSMYLNPGVEETRYIYVPYDGDGDYIIEFSDSYKTVEIVLPLSLTIPGH